MSEEEKNIENVKKGLDSLKDLKQEKAEEVIIPQETKKIEKNIDELGRSYATGKRKSSIARVWIKRGKGDIKINGSDLTDYFSRAVLRMVIESPFNKVDRKGEFDVIATVKGGGLSGQAGALRHGISRALVRFEPELRPSLKNEGFLTRDSRVVERKKYGKAKARRSFQFSKR